jgi:anhydro-N-acetylmuramic acid kinase
LECLFIEVENNQWNILHSQSIHYWQQIKDILQQITLNSINSLQLKDLAILDNLMTIYLTENVQQLLTQLPSKKRDIDLIALRKLQIFKGLVNEKKTPQYWNISMGDAHHLAYTVKIPILTDFARQHILFNGNGAMSTAEGDLRIAKKIGEVSVFVNIGLHSHMTAIDPNNTKLIIDSDTGPGTCLIDIAAQDAGCAHGFDRDGTGALTGVVNTLCLETLGADEWFKLPGPKEADITYLKNLLANPSVTGLPASDKLATLTALTALSINQFFKREYVYDKKPDCIWISGGGAHNLTLIDFLKSYFAPLPVKSIEESGIPANSKSGLALGLTINAHLNKELLVTQSQASRGIEYLGKWVYP